MQTLDDERFSCRRKDFMWQYHQTSFNDKAYCSLNPTHGFVHFIKILSVHIWLSEGCFRVATCPETPSDNWGVRRMWHLFADILISPLISSSSLPVYPLLHLHSLVSLTVKPQAVFKLSHMPSTLLANHPLIQWPRLAPPNRLITLWDFGLAARHSSGS